MSAESVAFIPHTSIDLAREQFEGSGHVGLTGLYDVMHAGPAIADAAALSLRAHPRSLGEQVTNLRRLPDPGSQPALHAVLQGIEEGAALLGRDITPSLRGEKPVIQILNMLRNTQGPLHQDSETLTDIVAITNLAGRSGLWFEDDRGGDGVEYTIEPGMVVMHDLRRRLVHRGYTGPRDERVGLAVAKRGTSLLRRLL